MSDECMDKLTLFQDRKIMASPTSAQAFSFDEMGGLTRATLS